MKKKKTNIYFSYFSSYNADLSQSQKRSVLMFMFYSGLFVLRTIFGSFAETLYVLAGMLSIAALLSFILTEWITPDDEVAQIRDQNYTEETL